MNRRVLAAHSVTLLVLTTACGGGGRETPFSDLGGDDVARAAVHQMNDVTSMRMTGDLHAEGEHEAVDMQVDRSGNCHGTIQVGNGHAELLSVHGKVWLKPDVAFFELSSPGHGRQLAAFAGDHWVVSRATSLSDVCDLDNFLKSFRGVAANPNATTIGPGEVDGQHAVRIQGPDDGGGTVTGWVATEGKHYLLQLKVVGSSPGLLTFSHFDEPVGAHAPDPSDVVDLNSSG